MKNPIIIIIFLLISIQSLSQTKTLTAEYILTIDKSDPYKVLVKAEFNTEIDSLYIHPFCPNYDYPDGWATFIKSSNDDLDYIGNSTWLIKNKKRVEYVVDLSFVKEKWDAGNEQAGVFIDSSMFTVTRALFLFPDKGGKYRVTFELPNNYSVTTPWESLGNTSFFVDTKEELNNNTVVWGTHETKTIQKDNFILNFVLLDVEKHAGKMVDDVFTKVLNSYLEIFPRTPISTYLITVFYASQNDGEAYASSNAFTLKTSLSDQNKTVWANQFAHELFHFWNGRMINGPVRSKRQWFSEGFTEYFANLTLSRTNIITEEEFYRLTEKTIGLHYYFRNVQYPDVSLVMAGAEKSKYRFGVYNGGWSAAFVLDMIIREKYPDKTLSDFMNILFERYGLTGEDYVYEDLEKEFGKFIRDNNNSFFASYINGVEMLPIDVYLRKMGIIIDYTSYKGTGYLYNDQNASNEEIKLKKQWLSK